MEQKSVRATFTCDGKAVDLAVSEGETLLSVLRERLGVVSAKDGCSPQGQCGCCTVLIDGEPRLACVTPVARVVDRTVTTLAGLPNDLRESLSSAFVAAGASQCGFCTPGIMVRAAALLEKANGSLEPATVNKALAAHLCRCTGWLSISHALTSFGSPIVGERDLDAAALRAEIEGGVHQAVGASVALGQGGFADDTAPRDALVAVPLPPGSLAPSVHAVGIDWVVADSVRSARARSEKIPGRRTTRAASAPLALAPLPKGGARLATGWVEPAYLEPDASWCSPGQLPASPLAQGGAFGAKESSPVAQAAQELSSHFNTSVRVLWAREDVVRLGPKRPPISATAKYANQTIEIVGKIISTSVPVLAGPTPYALSINQSWELVDRPGPKTSAAMRAFPLAELTVLIDSALGAAGVNRANIVRDDRVAAVLLSSCAQEPESGALAGAHVVISPESGAIEKVEVRVAAGDPLDEVVLRSYCVGAAHMALGWVLRESLTVDSETGEVLDLTIRSFDILPAGQTPLVEVAIIDDPGAARPYARDAVFAAVAAAITQATKIVGTPIESFPADTACGQRLLGR